MKHSKTLKKLPVRASTRELETGGVVPIRSHFTTREVNIDDKILKSFQDSADVLRKKLLDSDGNLKIGENIAADELIQLYTKKENGVDAGELQLSDKALSEVLSQTKYAFPNIIGGIIDKKFMKDIDMKSFVDMMTHPEFIKQTHEKAKMIKNKFEEEGVNTGDQIDPFSFNVNATVKNIIDVNLIIDSLDKKKIFSNVKEVIHKNNDLFNDDFYDEWGASMAITKVIKNGLVNNRKFTSTIVPSILLNHMTRRTDAEEKSFIYLNAYNKGAPGIPRNIILAFKNDFEKNGVVFGDVNEYRKKTVETLKGIGEVPNKDTAINFFNKVDDAHFFPALNYTAIQGSLPLQMETDKSILRDVQKISERIRGLTEIIKPTEKITLGASKNPLSILTMSPHKTAPSCQSIVDEFSGVSEITISTFNVNVLGALTSHKTNDFIMFKNNSNGEKAGRISLNYDGDVFRHFEEEPVYGEGKTEHREVKSFVKAFTPKLMALETEHTNINFNTKPITDKIRTLTEYIENQPLSKRSAAAEETILDPEVSSKIFENVDKVMSESFEKGLLYSGKSQLYGSDLYRHINNASTAVDRIRSMILDVNRKNHMQKMAKGTE